MHSMELTVSRQALERTLNQQLFAGPGGRYYLKGDPQSDSFISAEEPHLIFEQDRIVVRVKVRARLGKSVGGKWFGVSVALPGEVSLVPDAEGETIGFRDERFMSNRKEIDLVLAPFLRRQVPKSMKVNAADLLRKALMRSTASSPYKVNLDRLKVHSIRIVGDKLVADADCGISVE